MDSELNKQGLRIQISATQKTTRHSSVKNIAQLKINRLELRSQKTAMRFNEKHRGKVLGLFVQKLIKSPVTFNEAEVAALLIEKPIQSFLKPSNPQMLNSATVNSELHIYVSFKKPGICYKLTLKGQKNVLETHRDSIFEIIKTIKFKRH